VALDCLVDSPKPSSPSYDLFTQEKGSFLHELSEKGNLVFNKLNQVPGISCSPIQGSMYAFPKVR